jgi:hypothetical protein
MPTKLKVNVTTEQWEPAKRIARSYNDPEQLLEDFARYLAGRLSDDLKRSIRSQRYSRKWPPLSLSYTMYKDRKNLSDNTWEATGTLRKSITYWKQGGYWFVGIHPNKRYKGTPISVSQVARYLEYGTSKMPPRPLFRPLTSYYRKNIRRFWNDFMEERGADQ